MRTAPGVYRSGPAAKAALWAMGKDGRADYDQTGATAPGAHLPGRQGRPLRRSNFNKMAAWPHAIRAIGAEGLHFHDLRHTGNHFAAASGGSLKDLMARMGHDSERAAIIYQHEAQGADLAITSAIDAHIETAKAHQRQNGDGSPEAQLRSANGPLTPIFAPAS
jgi:integrase